MTILDYLKYYKDVSFDEVCFNEMDNLVFSALTYLPIENYDGSFYIKDILDKCHGKLAKLCNLMNGSRYKDLVMSNFKNIVNDETQFGALTIRFYKGLCYVGFRGTDDSITGWREDFELAYEFPVTAQKLAREYLKNTVKISDKIIFVGGHSKGGNLAMASCINLNKNILKKIKCIYNNDGPGFLKDVFLSEEFLSIKDKIKTFLPEESIVGILLNNCNLISIKSCNTGPKCHDLYSWECFGFFLVRGRLSLFSKTLKDNLNKWLDDTSIQKRKFLVDNFFKTLKMLGVQKMDDLKRIDKLEIKKISKNIIDILNLFRK